MLALVAIVGSGMLYLRPNTTSRDTSKAYPYAMTTIPSGKTQPRISMKMWEIYWLIYSTSIRNGHKKSTIQNASRNRCKNTCNRCRKKTTNHRNGCWVHKIMTDILPLDSLNFGIHYIPRSIFCDSSTWFKIKLATGSPWPSSNIRNTLPLPLPSERLSTSIKSLPLEQQNVLWQHGAGTPITSTSSTYDKSIFLLTYDGPKQKSRKGPHRAGWTRLIFRWLCVNLSE